jgi:hypothetical protein
MEHQPAAGRGGVQRFAQRPEPDTAAAQLADQGDEVLQGSGQSVQARYDEGVAGAKVGQARDQAGSVGVAAGLLVGEHLDAAGLGQGVDLSVEQLRVRRHLHLTRAGSRFWRRRRRAHHQPRR